MCVCVCVCDSLLGVLSVVVTTANNDMDKVGNSFLQLKMVLNKGTTTEEVFMGRW